jgi:ubiquinone/menaquinone biosynthesis C-methylase UbiE
MRDETSYRIIAPYYDWIMAHVDYDAWGRYLEKLWRRFEVDPKTILEIGAGTCPFARRKVYPAGAKVIYSDLSPFMLERANDVAPKVRVAANALALPFKARFKMCVMVYDAINYLMEEDDIARCFGQALRVLDKGGIFIFDITTEENSKRHFHQAVDFGELEGCTYYRESSYDKEARVQSNDFIFFVEGKADCWRKVKESHQQRIYKVEDIRSLAEEAGFKLEGIFEGFTFRAGRETSERVHFVLRKP